MKYFLIILLALVCSMSGVLSASGDEGTVTLFGIDANGNGVKDDVELYIDSEYKNEPKGREIFYDIARLSKKMLLEKYDKEKSVKNTKDYIKALDCYFDTDSGKKNDKTDTIVNFESEYFNTYDRFQAYIQINAHSGGSTFDLDELDCK